MPTDLLERPEITEGSREASRGKIPVADTLEPAPGKSPNQVSKSPWRRVFEGHEEFLGWTPD